jgi:hypothetical protein
MKLSNLEPDTPARLNLSKIVNPHHQPHHAQSKTHPRRPIPDDSHPFPLERHGAVELGSVHDRAFVELFAFEGRDFGAVEYAVAFARGARRAGRELEIEATTKEGRNR